MLCQVLWPFYHGTKDSVSKYLVISPSLYLCNGHFIHSSEAGNAVVIKMETKMITRTVN